MLINDHSIIRYTHREKILFILFRLMNTELFEREKLAIILYCGLERDNPLSFREIAEILSMPSARFAMDYYTNAIKKIRRAVEKSEISLYLVSFTPNNLNIE